MVNSWIKSQKIYCFLTTIETPFAEKNSPIESNGDLANWLSWARHYADSIDPILQAFAESPIREA